MHGDPVEAPVLIPDLQGKNKEALALCQRALKIVECVHGENQPLTAACVRNRARILARMVRLEFPKLAKWMLRFLRHTAGTIREINRLF